LVEGAHLGGADSPRLTTRWNGRPTAQALWSFPALLAVGRRSPEARVPCMRSYSGVKAPCPGRCGTEGQGKCQGVTVRWALKAAWNERAGRAGTQQQSPPSTMGLCMIHPASMHGRYDSLPREICGVSWTGLRVEQSSLTAPQKSAEGIGGTRERAEGLHGREESSPVVSWRDGLRRGVGPCPASGRNSRRAHRERTLRLGVYPPD